MSTPSGQLQIEEEIREWMGAALANSAFSRDNAAWNFFWNQVPGLAGTIYDLVSTAGYAGGGYEVKTGQITATGPTGTTAAQTFGAHGDFNVSVWSIDPTKPWQGKVHVERSFDNGANWMKSMDSSSYYFSLMGEFSIRLTEPEANVLYRLVCDAVTLNGSDPLPAGGGANYRFSQ